MLLAVIHIVVFRTITSTGRVEPNSTSMSFQCHTNNDEVTSINSHENLKRSSKSNQIDVDQILDFVRRRGVG